MKTFTSPKCITSFVSWLDAFTEFQRSLNYFLHRERISFSSMRMLLAESLMEYVTLDRLTRKWQMVWRNTLLAEKLLKSKRQPNFFYNFSLDFFTVKIATFRASVYRKCKLDDDLSRSKAWSASFFARIASLTFWLHQGVFFHYPPTF